MAVARDESNVEGLLRRITCMLRIAYCMNDSNQFCCTGHVLWDRNSCYQRQLRLTAAELSTSKSMATYQSEAVPYALKSSMPTKLFAPQTIQTASTFIITSAFLIGFFGMKIALAAGGSTWPLRLWMTWRRDYSLTMIMHQSAFTIQALGFCLRWVLRSRIRPDPEESATCYFL